MIYTSQRCAIGGFCRAAVVLMSYLSLEVALLSRGPLFAGTAFLVDEDIQWEKMDAEKLAELLRSKVDEDAEPVRDALNQPPCKFLR